MKCHVSRQGFRAIKSIVSMVQNQPLWHEFGWRKPMTYLPKIFQGFSEKYPDVLASYQELAKACRNAGPIDEKTQELIMLGIAVGANSRGGVMSHTRKALDAGISPEEILQVVVLSLTPTGFPNMIAALGWVKEVLEKGTVSE
jgi:4-carboxymuconolactone decarboxylase